MLENPDYRIRWQNGETSDRELLAQSRGCFLTKGLSSGTLPVKSASERSRLHTIVVHMEYALFMM